MGGRKKPKGKSKASFSASSRKFTCPTCGYVTFLKARFTKHVKYHSMPFIKCEFCDFKTQYTWNLDRHMKNHNDLGSMGCPLCNFTCDMKQSLTSHVQNHHNNVPEEVMAQFRGGSSSSVTSRSPTQSRRHSSEFMEVEPDIQDIVAGPSHRTSEEEKSIFTKKFYKCKFCKFNALSEQGLSHHVSLTHNRSSSSSSKMPVLKYNSTGSSGGGLVKTAVKVKPMPNLIPIPKSKPNVISAWKSAEPSPSSSPGLSNNAMSIEEPAAPQEEEFTTTDTEEMMKVQFLKNLGLFPKQESKRPPLQRKAQRRTSFFEKLSKKLSQSQSQTPSGIPTNSSSSSIISITSNSTRCQYCRHRCKSSVDLIIHLEQCGEAQRLLKEEEENEENLEHMDDTHTVPTFFFENYEQAAFPPNKPQTVVRSSPTSNNQNVTKSRKVYKCPQKDCEFWATTASRFHVHIVGHYNTKPFECSQCSYRSNWRWDITKHIRLKTMRDPSHSKAKVLLTHKSGERNYRKYDRYLVPMDVTYSADSKLPDCSTVASKRPDVELELVPPSSKSPGMMPTLTKAPTTSGGSFQTLRAALESQNLSMLSGPSITISPMSSSTRIGGGGGTRSFVQKNMLAGGEMLTNIGREITVTPISSTGNTLRVPAFLESQTQSQKWKCKKCSFKHWNKDTVISHINQEHQPKSGESMSILSQNNIVRVGQYGLDEQSQRYGCVYCEEIFKSQREARAHLRLHGVDAENDGEESDGGDGQIAAAAAEGVILPEEICTKPRGAAQSGVIYKKYHCQECPYLTDSRGQFIYHKRFHVPSPSAPYQCNICTYRVSHKHLLHQHVRVHERNAVKEEYEGDEDDEPEGDVQMQTTHNPSPRVLIWKDGLPYSVFRCRFCPQVFVDGNDLLEHEGQHSSSGPDANHEDEDGALNLSLKSKELPLLYLCTECPARFLYEKELRIHTTFHERRSEFQCALCSYSARQEVPHLMSHMKVHSQDYQDKTEALLSEKYRAAPNASVGCLYDANTKPFTMMKPVTISRHGGRANSTVCDASIPCRRCPAKFSTLASYLQHSQNHGKATPYPCRFCDFGAESKNNLTLHSILHAGSEVTIEPEVVLEEGVAMAQPFFVSTEELNIPTVVPQQNREMDVEEDRTGSFDMAEAFHGNPAFKYPTYVKNGRVKSKRYKCLKCPSAFEKRDQYRVHIGLHGSNQRYKCTVCDYSVTYYANFIQHLKKHENQADVKQEQLVARPLSKMNKAVPSPTSPQSVSVSSGHEKLPRLILKVPKSTLVKPEPEGKLESCVFCDFSSPDKESLKIHLRLHFDPDAEEISHVRNSGNENGNEDPSGGSDSDADDYEAVVNKANKKKGFDTRVKQEIHVDH